MRNAVTISPDATKAATLYEAAWECRYQGYRLCTLDEYETHHGGGTGCGYDSSTVWTSTLCPP